MWAYDREEEYSRPPKKKGSHMPGMYKEWLAYAIEHLFRAQSWGLHMYVSISHDLGVFGRRHICQPQISM